MHTKETRLDRERSRLARGVRSATRSAARIDPDVRNAAEQCFASAAGDEERQFWESYLAIGDGDSFEGFMSAGGDRAAGLAVSQFLISDLGRGKPRSRVA